MALKITTTPKSISISDSDRNTITVVKGENGIEYHSKLNNAGKNKEMSDIATAIKNIISKPLNSKDSFKVRFDRLAKSLTDIKTFRTMNKNFATA